MASRRPRAPRPAAPSSSSSRSRSRRPSWRRTLPADRRAVADGAPQRRMGRGHSRREGTLQVLRVGHVRSGARAASRTGQPSLEERAPALGRPRRRIRPKHRYDGDFRFDLPLSTPRGAETTESGLVRETSRRSRGAHARGRSPRGGVRITPQERRGEGPEGVPRGQGFDEKQVAAIRGLDGIDADFARFRRPVPDSGRGRRGQPRPRLWLDPSRGRELEGKEVRELLLVHELRGSPRPDADQREPTVVGALHLDEKGASHSTFTIFPTSPHGLVITSP